MFVSLRTKGIRKGSHLTVTSGHNHRTSKEVDKRIDPTRTHLNQHLIKTADDIPKAVYKRIKESGAKPPKDAVVMAQEVTLSASPEYFRPSYHRDDPEGWGKYDPERMEVWRDLTVDWLKNKFGKDNIVDVVLHLDERTPHIHAIVTPITEVTLKKRRTAKQKEANEPNETYTKLKWNRTQVFGHDEHNSFQGEYANALKSLGLKKGIPKKLTKQEHKSIKDYHKEQWELLQSEIVYPDTSYKVDSKIEGFKLPEPKMFESAKTYIKRCTEEIKDIVSEQIDDSYQFKIKQFNEALEMSKTFTALLAHEAQEQKEKNDILTKTLIRINDAIDNPDLVNKILAMEDPEKKLDTKTELVSDAVKFRKKTLKKEQPPSLNI